jgi:hypothetical protein
VGDMRTDATCGSENGRVRRAAAFNGVYVSLLNAQVPDGTAGAGERLYDVAG